MNMYKLFAFSMGIIFSTISESHAAFCMPADSNPTTDGKNHYIASYPVNHGPEFTHQHKLRTKRQSVCSNFA